MSRVPNRLRRIYHPFALDMDEIKIERIKLGVDKKLLGDARITRGIKEHPLWQKIKFDITRSPRRKGAVTDLFVIMVVLFLVFIGLGIFLFTSDFVTTQFQSLPSSQYFNVSESIDPTIGVLNQGVQGFNYITIALVVALVISFFITNVFIKAHPVFFIPYTLVVVLAVVFAVFISNAYESVLNNFGMISPYLHSLTGGDYIMLNLPYVIGVIGLIGGIFLFININRDADLGGGIE